MCVLSLLKVSNGPFHFYSEERKGRKCQATRPREKRTNNKECKKKKMEKKGDKEKSGYTLDTYRLLQREGKKEILIRRKIRTEKQTELYRWLNGDRKSCNEIKEIPLNLKNDFVR